MELLHQLTTKSSLLAIGISLVVAGIMMRGFAGESLRAQALRKQHELHNRKPGQPQSFAPLSPEPGWFEKSLPFLANFVALSGVVVTIVSFFRK